MGDIKKDTYMTGTDKKNTVSETRHALDGINSRLETSEKIRN